MTDELFSGLFLGALFCVIGFTPLILGTSITSINKIGALRLVAWYAVQLAIWPLLFILISLVMKAL